MAFHSIVLIRTNDTISDRYICIQLPFLTEIYEPRHEKSGFSAYAKTKAQISCANQRLCFRHVDSTILLLPSLIFQASSHQLWLYRLVCVRPDRKPRRQVLISDRYIYSNPRLSVTRPKWCDNVYLMSAVCIKG